MRTKTEMQRRTVANASARVRVLPSGKNASEEGTTMGDETKQDETTGLSRREFLAAAGGILASTPALAAAAEGGRAMRVTTERITYQSGDKTIGAALNRPEGDEQWPGIIVIHENRGLTDYIRDVARQLAAEGYVTLAPNLVSRKLGPDAPAGTEEAMAALRELSTEDAVADLGAGLDHLKKQACARDDRLGSVGFCYGGRLSLLLAGHRPDLDAAVVFYGRPADALPLVPKMKAAVLASFGAEDRSIPPSVARELEEALAKANIPHDVKVYSGAGHAFHRPGGESHHPEAARDAWQRTLAWFQRYLKG